MKELTVNSLLALVRIEIAKGNGDKKILVSDDDEGNGFHSIFYGFTPTQAEGDPLNYFDAAYISKPDGVTDENVNDYIILG